jgi:hypothetical protein
MVDPPVVKLFRFDVTTGTAHRYSSEFAYHELIDPDGMREVTVQARSRVPCPTCRPSLLGARDPLRPPSTDYDQR